MPDPCFSLLSYKKDDRKARALDIYYLDDLLKIPDFWYSTIST
jgi:hypothetical protein